MAFERKHPPKPKREPMLARVFEDEAPFDDPDDIHAVWADEALERYQQAPIKHKLAAQWRWRKLVANCLYRETEPREIPVQDLKIIAKLSSHDPLDTKAAERIKSPLTGIRAYCINCQGGSPSNVRNCTMSTCVLFPFRMGSNPFYGRLADADIAAEDMPEPEETTDADQDA